MIKYNRKAIDKTVFQLPLCDHIYALYYIIIYLNYHTVVMIRLLKTTTEARINISVIRHNIEVTIGL